MQALGNTKNHLRNLLKYTDELLSFNEKVAFDLSREPYPHFHEFQVASLEGVDTAVDGEIWLKIRRLRESRPPDCDPIFEGWTDFGAHPSADQPPRLAAERMLHLSVEEVSDLAESGLIADPGDVMRPVGADDTTPERMDVILRTENMPEFSMLWQDYIKGAWATWAEAERPRRRSIKFYNDVYQIYQRMIALGDDTPIELVVGVGVARWQLEGHRINVPLIEQLVEIELEESGTLVVRPRPLPPLLALKVFHALEVEGSKAVQRDIGEHLERTVEDADIGFSPFEKRSFEKILRACSARLSPTGVYHADTLLDPAADRTLPDADGFLRITDTWTIYVRQRSGGFRRDDIARLIKRVEEVEDQAELPPPAVCFVAEPSDEILLHPADDIIDITGRKLTLPDEASGNLPWSTLSGSGSGRERASMDDDPDTFFFPLPFNDDQEEIIRRLEDEKSDGTVVQGPPGTGKTHTIANIICHFLATGRRILVTAKTPEALKALQEKIPEGIRDLAISVIHNDREGARQLQHAVQLLAEEAKSIDVRFINGQIRERHVRLAALRDAIRKIDGQFQRLAERNLVRLVYDGNQVSPMELAQVVADQQEQHRWFQDELVLGEEHDPQFSDVDIDEARVLRRLLSRDLAYKAERLPDPDGLPEVARIIAAHGELQRVDEIETAVKEGEIPYMKPDLETARRLRDWVSGFDGFMHEVANEQWLLDVHHYLLGLKALDPAPLDALKGMCAAWSDLHRRGRDFVLKALACDHADDLAFDRALEDLTAGRKPFGMFSMFKAGLKAKVESTRIEGRLPSSREEWVVVRTYRIWQKEAQRFVGRWGGIARAVNLPDLPSEWEMARGELLRLGRLVEQLLGFHDDLDAYRRVIQALFPYGIDADEVLHHGRCESVIEALGANLEKVELAAAVNLRSGLKALARDVDLPFYAAIHDFCANLGNSGVPQGAIAEAWQEIVAEGRRLDGLHDQFRRLDEIVSKVAASGGSQWARQLRHAELVGDDDPCTPRTWRATWEWARADGYLRTLGDRQMVRKLSDARSAAEAEQRRLLTEVVRLRTFLGLKRTLTQRVEAALARFTTAIARLGKGTGKAAGRHRRIIRDAAIQAAQAVPCWILPEWRVGEQLPAELAAFDLVIIDEASQSDITVFPVILRGKKVLIVGDDKQVSPTPVGVEDRKIVQLRTTFLTGIPFADQMDPATSLYEIAGMIYPGKAIILREHFRCVEPIIGFSSRFYAKPLVPLRLPTASERLDPPLIDIYVPFGRKVREVNEAELDVIVTEITKIVADPAFVRRSIGVISLIGNAQANQIYTRLITDLGAEVIEKHRIMCGNAATFQGQERDIVFLSMVACPETAVAQTSRLFEQRFNVAASRARDRLVLVRSVASSDLKPGDLKLALIDHFRSPMEAGKLVRPNEVLDLCQSDFERDFGGALLDLGYRLRPQVPVGGYSIDFVVEGAEDRRLAVELDGDNYHGPDKWAADIRRQRAMERLGWTFWRCWGSAWIADREACLTDLMESLQRLGIEPVGMGEWDGHFTRHIEIAAPTLSKATLGLDLGVPEMQRSVPETVVPLTSEILVDGLTADQVARPATYEQIAASETAPIFADLNRVSVEVGDLVFIRYDDQPDRPLSIRLSGIVNKPSDGIVHISQPLGAAILGASLDEQVNVTIGDRARSAVIEKIEKARSNPELHGG